MRFRFPCSAALLVAGLSSTVLAQTTPPLAVMDLDVYPAVAAGVTLPDSAAEVFATDFTRHGVDDVAVLSTTGDVFLLSAPNIHQEYRQLASGVSAMAVFPGAGVEGADGLLVSDGSGLRMLLLESSQNYVVSTAVGCQGASILRVADWDADGDLDIVVLDENVAGVPGVERITLIRNGGAGSFIAGDTKDYTSDVCEIEIARDWFAAGKPAIYVVENLTVRALDPNHPSIEFYEPYLPFQVPSTSLCVSIEIVTENGVDKVALAHSMPEPSINGERSYLAVVGADPASPFGFVALTGITLRDARLRGMWSGSYLQDDYTDLLIAFSDGLVPLPHPDLYLNGFRNGGNTSFTLDPGFSSCLQLSPEVPQTTSGFAFTDIDGDEESEFVFATDATGGLTELVFAESPAGGAADEPVLASTAPGFTTAGNDQVVTLTFDYSGLPAYWAEDHIEIVLWRVYGEQSSPGSIYAHRHPFLRAVGAVPTDPAQTTVSVTFTGSVTDFEGFAYYGVARYVQDPDPATTAVDRAGPAYRFLLHPLAWQNTLPGEDPYIDAVNSVPTVGLAREVQNSDLADGGIPLIIDPIGLPPVPPLPPAPVTADPPAGTGTSAAPVTAVGAVID